ncbi:Carbohydrate-Binding Module Family 1 protein, cellulose binding protein [Pseudohyphozyma bogoriensis]|nr:Carbohydrate-Binding Module Family 1 protein, cellulose binding protein [Pseudohyphozyma bogoriensis]
MRSFFGLHPDDDLLFQSPDLVTDISSGACITHISLTSGDSGQGSAYAQSRESGNEAAWAEMAGVADTWTESDGNVDGSGYLVTGYETLRELYMQEIYSITSQPGTATFTMMTLQQALAQIMTARAPARIRTLDHLSDYDAGDHSDHLTTGRITSALAAVYAPNATFSGYMGYPASNLAPNVDTTSTGFAAKVAAFGTYAPYDTDECPTYSVCVAQGRGEASWMVRQYAVTPEYAEEEDEGIEDQGVAQSAAMLPNGTDIALMAVATASSVAAGQPIVGINDGVIGGYPGNSTAEWSSNGQGVGATATLTWNNAKANITSIVLYDRKNLNDWIKGGYFTFSDGSTYTFGQLWNDGSATVFNLPAPVITKSIVMTVTAVGPSTTNVGLQEWQVYGTLIPIVSTLLSSSTTSTASYSTINLAFDCNTVVASSQDTVDASYAYRAIDGLVGGYTDDNTGDQTLEWSSNGEKAGALLTLTWPSPVQISKVVLYDRPNAEDQITGATITFDSGAYVKVGSLPNAGTAYPLYFSPVTTSSLVFNVTSVSSTTSNVGLADFQIFALANSTTAQGLNPVNWARYATATASASAYEQDGYKAIDGKTGGQTSLSTSDFTQEWNTGSAAVGATLTLAWASKVTLSSVVLYDRPNTNDWVTGGTLAFSDGTTYSIPALNNSGGATPFNFNSTQTSSLVFTITSVGNSTTGAGLSEIQAFTAPSTASNAVSLTKFNGTASVNSTTAGTTAAASTTPLGSYSSIDLAFDASVTASSQDSADTSYSYRATDGLIGGYTDDGTGDEVAKVVLYDRPNAEDQVLSASLKFSDASIITVGSLVNNGSATAFYFNPRNTTSLIFTVVSVSSTTSNVGLGEIQVYSTATSPSANGLNPINWARYSTATSSTAAYKQGANKAVDGQIGGSSSLSTSDSTMEWASGSTIGASITLKWPYNVTIGSVILYDRPNTNDWCTGGTIAFGDGSKYSVPSLNNDGSATPFNLPTAISTSSLVFTVASVGASTTSVGLSELQVFTAKSTASNAVTLSTTSTQSGSSNSTSTSGAASTTPLASAYSSIDLAFDATVSASSQDSADTSYTYRATDGNIGGYTDDGTGDESLEWSSDHGVAGTTLTLSWASKVEVSKVVLYDRPNSDDQVTSGSLTFSDGSVITVGSLNNDGSATTFYFAPRNTTSLLFTVLGVSSTTSNVGLSEIQAYSTSTSVSANGLSTTNWARYAVASASSAAYKQGANKANDGQAGGSSALSTSDYTMEWATSSGGVGSTLLLTWASKVSLSSVVLYDRPNTNDWVTSSTLSFSDGTVLTVPALTNNGSACPFNFAPISTSSLLFTVTGVGASTSAVGLSEIQAYSAANSTTPVNDALYSTINLVFDASITASSQDTVDASYTYRAGDGLIGGYTDDNAGDQTLEWSSNGEGAGAKLTVTWGSAVQISKVVLYDRPNNEDQVLAGTLTFSDGTVVQVGTLPNNGSAFPVYFPQVTTTSMVFQVTQVSPTTSNVGLAEIQAFGLLTSSTANGLSATNWARYASSVTASSSSYEQGANKVIDGQVGGYSTLLTSDFTKEWATNGQGVGATLKLTWASPVTLGSVVLYDRPNTNDWCTGGILTFSDGSTVSVGSLPNDGSALAVNFASRSTTSLLFTVTSVGSATGSVGLAELQAFSGS